MAQGIILCAIVAPYILLKLQISHNLRQIKCLTVAVGGACDMMTDMEQP